MLLKLILCVLLYFYLCDNRFEHYTLSEDCFRAEVRSLYNYVYGNGWSCRLSCNG